MFYLPRLIAMHPTGNPAGCSERSDHHFDRRLIELLMDRFDMLPNSIVQIITAIGDPFVDQFLVNLESRLRILPVVPGNQLLSSSTSTFVLWKSQQFGRIHHFTDFF